MEKKRKGGKTGRQKMSGKIKRGMKHFLQLLFMLLEENTQFNEVM